MPILKFFLASRLSLSALIAATILTATNPLSGAEIHTPNNDQSLSAKADATENPKVLEAKIDSYIRSLPEPFSGTILLAIGDHILMNKGYGLANIAFDIPNNDKTRYEIASATKHFTSVLTLQMAEKGLIDLNATIDRYLPDFPKDKACKITVHHLLLHQSGIAHHINAIDNYLNVQIRLFHTPDEYIKLFSGKNLAHNPGEKTTYTSPGYFLLAVILEKVSGKSYAELLEENIFQPLGMRNTFVGNNKTIIKNMATGYSHGLDGLILADVEEMSNRLGAGDLISTTEDLYRFLKAMNLNSDSILSKEYKELLFKPHQRFSRFGASYIGMLNFTTIGNQEDTLLGIGEGSSFGYRSRMTKMMKSDAYYIVLSNISSDRAMGQEMYHYLEKTLSNEIQKADPPKGEQTPQPKQTAGFIIDKKILDTYQGFYKRAENTFMYVARRDDRLSLQVMEDYYGFARVSDFELIPTDNNAFVAIGQKGLEYHFILDTSRDRIRIEIAKKNKIEANAESIRPAAIANSSDFCGDYYSIERQRTYHLSVENDQLTISGFSGQDKTVLTHLEKDLFGCDHGFLTFHRYSDGKVRDFKINTQDVDSFAGFFIKK